MCGKSNTTVDECIESSRMHCLVMMVIYLCDSGYAPFSPFMTTISKQRGYSAFMVGLIFTLLPIPVLITTPIIAAITDKYKCRRTVFIACSILVFVFVCLLAIIPGTTSEEMSDLEVITSPLFWLFFLSNSLIAICGRVKSVLDDTICMDLLGK